MIEIKHWLSGMVLYSSTKTTLREAIEEAAANGARLDGARLDGASLDGASLVRARLDGARLDGASLDGARLDGARLDGARLDGASLDGASLDPIRDDFFAVLDAAPSEVPALRVALREGRINGSTYSGECACLMGTIANARGCSVDDLRGTPIGVDSNRLAEVWFLGIQVGDTPALSPLAAITDRWIGEWTERRTSAAAAAVATGQG